jgi:hypothetical protein
MYSVKVKIFNFSASENDSVFFLIEGVCVIRGAAEQPLLSATSSSHGRGAKQWRLRGRCSRPSVLALRISPAASRPYISHPPSTHQRGGCAFAGRRHLVQPSSASSTPPTSPRRPKRRWTVGLRSPWRRTTGEAHCTAPTNSCVIENTKDADVLRRPLLCGSAACHRIWRARFGSRGRRPPISSTLEACELSYDSHWAYVLLAVASVIRFQSYLL